MFQGIDTQRRAAENEATLSKRSRRKRVGDPARGGVNFNGLLGALGVFIGLVSVLFVVVFVGQLIEGSRTERGVLVGLVVFFLGTAVAGAALARKCFHRPPTAPPPTESELEQRILDFAKQAGGRVTVPEVAADCDLSLEDSKRLLDHFVLDEAADALVTDDGIMVYRFHGFLSPERKARARDF